MCGFSGFFTGSYTGLESGRIEIKAMCNAIAHRGPDDAGIWLDSTCGIGFAHRRLSILDLSPAGHQPMSSVSGRYLIVFNGEIYNHKELRNLIPINYSWNGHSDTETLLAGIETWGIQATLEKCRGMFALAVWDKHSKTLTLARDRIGEKPLYYGWQNGVFLFGSELKALRVHPSFSGEIDHNAIALQLRHNYIPAPYSIYCGIHKLLPGHWLQLSLSEFRKQEQPISCPYWSLVDVANFGIARPYSGTTEQAIDELDTLLHNAVSQQMTADVSLGAFLSGGVDSSMIVALMQAQSSQSVKTFSIGFNEAEYNEAVHAKAVASHLGTDHTELYVTPEQAMAVIQKLPIIYDEPFSDSSQIPTYLVSQLAKQSVTVSLSGDAGDELFCGYNRYQVSSSLWRKLRLAPVSIRQVLAALLKSLSPSDWTRLAKLIPGASRYPNFGDKLYKGAGVLSSQSLDELYLGFVTHWPKPSDIVLNSTEPPTFLTGHRPDFFGLDGVQEMMLLDSLSYLPDDILAKVDRAAMAVSLESRVPFLDHRVVEFGWRLPKNLKLRNGQSKWILRQVLYRYVPKKLIERPKMGFGVPIDKWLRGPLRDWAETLLSERRLGDEGFFNPAPIRQKWSDHLSGKRNWQYHLWDVLMFQQWYETYRI